MKKIWICALFLVSASACYSRTKVASEQPATTLKVQNDALLDMSVYVLREGQRMRLGTATAHAATVMTIPPAVFFGPTALQFEADPIGASRKPVTEEITVSPGDEVTLLIPPL
jgi:hypothetical protein